MIEEGLASGVRNDSLFLGTYLGMNKKDFYAHCWELNKKGIIKQGPSNLSVQHDLDSLAENPIWMHFYPEFIDNKIWKMPVQFRYKAWAPWNRRLFNDSLITCDVIPLAETWFGKGFKEFKHPDKPSVWVKVDGNRLVRIQQKLEDDQIAEMTIADLVVKEKIDPKP